MELRQLQYFVSIIDNNSFSAAAEENYISQSAISQQIKILEKELGYDLLVRKNRGFSLTIAGDYFYKESKRILTEIDNMKVKTKLLASNDKYTLRIGYLLQYDGNELMDTILEFKEKYPEVEIELIAESHEELSSLTFSDGIDLMFGDQRKAFSNIFHNYLVANLYKYINIANYNRLATKERITLQDIQNEPCVIVCSKEQRMNESKYYKEVLGFRGNFIYANSLSEAKLLVASNKGFFIQTGKIQEKTPFEAMEQIPYCDDDGQLTGNYYAYWKKSISNPIIEEFAKILKSKFQGGF